MMSRTDPSLDDEEEELEGDLEEEKKNCRGYRRQCRNKAKVEGKWCGLCNNRRLGDFERKVREQIKQESELLQTQLYMERLKVQYAKAKAKIEGERHESLAQIRRAMPTPLLLAHHQRRTTLPVVIEEVASPAIAARPPPPAAEQVSVIPMEVAQQIIGWIREKFPQGTTIEQLRTLPDCPPNWSDRLLAELIQGAAVK